MRKVILLCSALAVTFLMSTDLHSSSEGALQSRETIEYCSYDKDKGTCSKKTTGDACYLVDDECNWMDDQEQPED